MEQMRRGPLLLVIVMMLVVVLVWYYFAQVYQGSPSTRGTLVEWEDDCEYPSVYQAGENDRSI